MSLSLDRHYALKVLSNAFETQLRDMSFLIAGDRRGHTVFTACLPAFTITLACTARFHAVRRMVASLVPTKQAAFLHRCPDP